MLLGATVGAGIFALPEIFARAGFLSGFIYLGFFSALLIYVHWLFSRAAETAHSGSLYGSVARTLGPRYAYVAFLSIVCGLILTLVVFLVIGAKFLLPIFGNFNQALFFFWLLASLPILLSLPRFTALETLGAFFMVAAIIYIFFSAPNLGGAITPANFAIKDTFLPFGAILFALAGWTGVPPLLAILKGERNKKSVLASLILGTLGSALLYAFFVVGIAGSTEIITSDTISGLIHWPPLKIFVLIALGLFAVWTSYLPISIEIKDSFAEDLGIERALSTAIAIFLPLLLVWVGLTNVMKIIALAGGVFLSFQYIFILLFSRKVLRLRGFHSFASALSIVIFFSGALYEVYYFAVK